MHVVGTAGHVDHGKSALVEALTGTHPDRLKEEREREMTIDLGFAWATLPGGQEIGFVDVPGHRDFIENMLAGVGGIDAALFVVAADEGVMPQTREHLAILDLLQIKHAVVALAKIDLVDDNAWLELVETDMRQLLSQTTIAGAPIVRVSAKTGAGLADLQKALSKVLALSPERVNLNRPRLPIDRVFTISGFGTVVTGTLAGGLLKTGDEIEILPQGLRGRVRGLETHKKKAELAVPGSRTAVNIGGIDHGLISRGNLLAHPGAFRPTRRLDVAFRLLPDASRSLQHNVEVKLFIGAAETVARVRLLGAQELKPGEQGWLQLESRDPIIAVRGDRYILRSPSPGETIGGGAVLDAHPNRRSKRFDEKALARLDVLARGSAHDVFLQSVLSAGTASLNELVERNGLDRAAASEALDALVAESKLFVIRNSPDDADPLIAASEYWDDLIQQGLREVSRFHERQPLRRGMSREELRNKLDLSEPLFAAFIKNCVEVGSLAQDGPLVFLPGHAIRFTAEEEKAVDDLIAQFAAQPFAPPTVKECIAALGDNVYQALLDLDTLVQVSDEVVFRREDYQRILVEIRSLIEEKDSVTAAAVRDHFKTTRRYALALLEHLDAEGVTVREGDLRRLK